MNGPFSDKEVKEVIVPLLDIVKKQKITGFQGGQGVGKTELVRLLVEILKKQDYKAIGISIDDFYLDYASRKKLAEENPDNPFYQIPRGMPGTHDVPAMLNALRNLKQGKPAKIPVFDKSLHNAWGDIVGQREVTADIILFEGWCLGMPYVSVDDLRKVYDIAKLDPTGNFSKVVLDNVRDYQPIWDEIDFMIRLKAPNPESHQKWRNQKEEKMIKEKGTGMTKDEIYAYVEKYLPFTYLCYEQPQDLLITMDKDHKFQISSNN